MPNPKIAVRPVASLKRDPNNARVHGPEQLEWLKGSIRRFGWTVPAMIVADTIYAGNGRHEAAEAMYADGETLYFAPGKENGGAPIPAGQMPIVDCTGWSEDERKAYALADNQLALQASWDDARLKTQLEELATTDISLDILGFDSGALDALAQGDGGVANPAGRTIGELTDSAFQHTDQFAVIVRCADAAEQEARFVKLRDEYGADHVKVVVV